MAVPTIVHRYPSSMGLLVLLEMPGPKWRLLVILFDAKAGDEVDMALIGCALDHFAVVRYPPDPFAI